MQRITKFVHSKFSLMIGAVILAIMAAICVRQYQATLYVGTTPLAVTRAVSNEEKENGLLGYKELAENQGMLFVFDEADIYQFHMVGMAFPLDFIWIAGDGTIIDITPDVQPQLANVANDMIQLYAPQVPARYVLEVNAGWAQRHSIRIGMHVSRL